ncbi:hypothetical protein K2P56_00345 [Patescibacteria group bacterium]|nr:hypothetical protein [Patescibacteria group bacterium]
MATSPTPDSAIRTPRREERVVTSRTPRAVETAQPVDQEALARVRQEELDEQWRNGGRFE